MVVVEPQLDPASELQAIGRVHRIGQERETWVHRCGGRCFGAAADVRGGGLCLMQERETWVHRFWAGLWRPPIYARLLTAPRHIHSLPPCTPLTSLQSAPPHPSSSRFVVEDTVEESVHALSQQRAARMDCGAYTMTPVTAPGDAGGRGVRSPVKMQRAAAAGGAGGVLTVRDVAVLLRLSEG